jgi:hypothetical protein
MRLNCYCQKGVEIPPKTFKYVLDGFDLFCGPDCFLKFIKEFQGQEILLNPRGPFVTRVFEVWDYDTNQFYRSMFEVYVARFFKDNGFQFYYEPHTFRLGSHLYTPDFYLSDQKLYVEVKGRWNSGAKQKIREAAKGINLAVLPAYLQPEFAKQYKTKDDIVGRC